MNKRILGVVLMVMSGLTVASIASAGSCKNVDLEIDNQSDKYIKVKYALYRCEGENEKKEMFSNTEVQPGQKKVVAANQNLAGCKDKKMDYLEYHYEVKCDGKWSKDRSIRDKSFANAFCSSDTGKKYVVQLPSATCD